MSYKGRDPTQFQEHKAVQIPALKVLNKIGYDILSPEDAEKQRGSLNNVLLKEILYKKLNELNSFSYKSKNYNFSDKNIKQAISDLDLPLTNGLVKTNERIFDILMLGKTYEENLDGGIRKSFSLNYIDWENIENNEFTAVEEFSVEVEGTSSTKRPDIVLFVNGIPFAVIECKREKISELEAVSQHIGNQAHNAIPQLFKFIQILFATNKHKTKYGTCNTPKKFWSVWNEQDKEFLDEKLSLLKLETKPTKQDMDLISLFSPERLLDFTENFILFDKDVKKVPRYQQYFATKAFIDHVNQFDENGNRQSGVVWHTQGSGKSLAMVMYAKYVFSKLKAKNPKVIVVTDRKDLDKQIYETFNHTKLKASKANTGNHLVKLIKNNDADIITTIINKFESASKKLSAITSKDIFVLVDESHRSNYGLMYINMKKTFPNACYIGFTGTPLMKETKNTMRKFGKITKPIHQYTISDAVKDKTVVPLLYEGKFIPQKVNRCVIDKRLDLITKRLTPEKKEQVKARWAKFEKLAGVNQRIELIAQDIFEHYDSHLRGTPFNAMLATNSKVDAIKYLNEFELNTDLNCRVVISSPDTRTENEEVLEDDSQENQNIIKAFWDKMMKKYGSEEEYVETITSEFVDGEEIDLLIVVDKLLTGFDAPKASVLYIDKKLKEHNLLQAIARVNRLKDGKDYGLIIDYRGLLKNLNDALDIYSSAGLDKFEKGELEGAVYDVMKILKDLRDSYQSLINLFLSVKNKSNLEAYSEILDDDEIRDEFYSNLSQFGKNLSLAFDSEEVFNALKEKELKDYKRDIRFFRELRSATISRLSDDVDHLEYEKQMENLMNNHVLAGEVERLTPPVDILDKIKFQKELDRQGSKKSKADTIRTRMQKSISEKWNENPALYEKFSKKLDDILQKYKNLRITEAQYLEENESVYADFVSPKQNNDNYPSNLRSNSRAGIIYDNISKYYLEEHKLSNKVDELGNISLLIDEIIKKHIKIDYGDDILNKIEQEVEDLIHNFESNNNIGTDYDQIDKILENLRLLIKKNYD